MKSDLALFLFDMALKGTKVFADESMGFGFFNPYDQYPKHRPKLGYMDRPLFEGHKTYPHLSKPGFGQALGTVALGTAKRVAPIASGALTIKAQKELAEEKGFVPSGSSPGGSFSFGFVFGF